MVQCDSDASVTSGLGIVVATVSRQSVRKRDGEPFLLRQVNHPNADSARRALTGEAHARELRARSVRRCSLDWLDQRLRRERFCEIGDAPRLKGSFANSGIVVPCHENDGD
jgi:hypothetical protein